MSDKPNGSSETITEIKVATTTKVDFQHLQRKKQKQLRKNLQLRLLR